MKNLIYYKNLSKNPKIIIDDKRTSKYVFIKYDNKEINYIYKDQIINNMVSSMSGNFVKYDNVYINNKLSKVYCFKNDLKDNRLNYKGIKNNYTKLTKDELYNISVNKNEINTYNKLNNKTIIISCLDKPYEYSNLYNMYYNKDLLIENINYLIKVFNIEKVIFLFRSNKDTLINSFINELGLINNSCIKLVPNIFIPNIKEYILKNYNTDNYINSNDIIEFLYKTKLNKYYPYKFITIYNEIENIIKVIRVYKYSNVTSICNDNGYIYYNGPIFGYKIDDINKYIFDDNITSITVLKKDYEKECTRCKACNKICPYKINILNKYKTNKIDKCNNCGLCNYICPSNINITKILGGNNHD